MKLTLVICTYNRSQLLLKALASINNADKPAHVDFKILIIVNACADDTVEQLQAYQNQLIATHLLPIHFIEELNAGKSYALNSALSQINEGWIGFIDDDHRIDEQYLNSVITAINCYPDARLFCGKIIPDWTGKEPDWVHDDGNYKITPFPIPNFNLGNKVLSTLEELFIPGGGNLIVNKKVFDIIGNFSEVLGPVGHNLMGSEDSDFVLRAIKAKQKLVYIPMIIQYHYVELNHLKLSYLILKSFQRNRSITLAHFPKKTKIPKYLWAKLGQYIICIVFNFKVKPVRFYLTKSAGIVGQIIGHIQSLHQ